MTDKRKTAKDHLLEFIEKGRKDMGESFDTIRKEPMNLNHIIHHLSVMSKNLDVVMQHIANEVKKDG